MTWIDEMGMQPIAGDVFGARLYRVDFGTIADDEEVGDDIPEDDDVEEDTKELACARAAQIAWLIVFPNGHELWTTSGEAYARELLGADVNLFSAVE